MSKLFSKRRAAFLILFVFAVALFFIPVGAQADSIGDIVVLGLGKLVQIAVEFLGKILIAVIDMLVQVAQYNDFGDSAAVNIGWVITRDLANMLFIIALIVISFGTILQWEQYRYNRLLGKLVLTVILVNFSKAISLFLIDFSQVIMMTFVNAFKDVAAGNLTTGFGIRALLAYADSSTSVDINVTSTVLVYALAIVLILIALIVTISLVVILVRRIISLWIIIILAPLAFIASIMPGGVGSYNAGWWKRLGQEMFVGPALAFFLWLSFSIIFLTSGQGVQETATIVSLDAEGTVLEDNTDVQATVSQIGSTANLFNFVAVIVLLIHSMTIAQQAGGFAGKFASRASGWIDQGGSKLVKGIGRAPKKLSDFTGVSGVAARAGYFAADKGLKPLQSIPLIGGKFRKARARINEKRDYIDPATTRYIKSQSNEELASIGDGMKATRSGVVERRAAVEELMRRGKSHYISDKGMRKYLNAIGYSAKIEREDPNDPNSKIVGVSENARYREGLEQVFKSRWEVPRLYNAIFSANATADEKKAIEAEFDSDLKKATKGEFLKFTLEGLQKDKNKPAGAREKTELIYDELNSRMEASDRFAAEIVRDATTPLRYVIANKGKPFPETTRERYRDTIARRRNLGIEDEGLNTDVLAEQAQLRKKNGRAFTGALTPEQAKIEQLIAGGKSVDDVEKDLVNYKKTRDLSDAEYRQQYALYGYTPLADASEEQRQKFENEKSAREALGLVDGVTVDEMKAGVLAYKAGDAKNLRPEVVRSVSLALLESNKTPDQLLHDLEQFQSGVATGDHYSDAKYENERRIFEQLIRQQGDTEDERELVGADSFIRRAKFESANAARTGRQETHFLKADLAKLGLSGRGLHLGDLKDDAEKTRIISGLEDMYRKQLSEAGEQNQDVINQKVQEFGDAVRSAQNLAFINTKAAGYTDLHTARHERAHSEMGKLSSADQEALFDVLPKEEQDRIIQDVAKQWNLSSLPQAEQRKRAIEEYLTEGLANYGRSDAVGSELDSDLALAMKRKGVKFRAYTNLEQAAPQVETSVPLDLYNESLQRYERFATSPTLSDEDYDRYFEDEIKKGTLLESRKMRAQAVRDGQTVRLQGVSAEQPPVMSDEQQAAQAAKIPDEELSTKAVSDFQLRRMNWMAQKKAQTKTALQSGTSWIQKELSEFLGDQKLAFYEGTGVKTLMDGTKAGLQKLLDKRREFFTKRKADRTNEPLRQSREAVDAYSQETAPIHMDQLRKRRSDAQQKHDEASGALANLKEEERRIQRDIAEYNKQATAAAQAGNLDKAREFSAQAREGQNNLGQVKKSIKSTERTVAQTQDELTEAQEAEKSAMGNLFASTDKLSKRFDAIAASLPEDGLKNLSSLAGQELEDLNVQSLESAWSGDIESAKRFQEQANGFVIARKRIESTMQSRVTPPESVPPSRAATQPVSRETLEADARRQETIVNGLQRQIDERVAEMQEQLPEGLHIEDLSNPNPLVAKNVSEKGVPEAFRREMQQLHETLRTESKALRDINDTLQHQIRLEKERAQETSRAIERGMKSAHQETSKIDKKAAEAAPRPNPQQNQPKSGQTPTQEQSRVPKNDTPKGPDTIA